MRKTFVKGAPDWALEIVSPTSVARDYEEKRAQYERFGVGEYWIIDPLSQSMTAYRSGKGRKYKEIKPRDGRLTAHVIAGFWVKPTWFWQSPLPDEDEALREILTGANGKR